MKRMTIPPPQRLVTLAWRVTTLIWWANFALTTRWADVPGSVHGARRPWFLTALALFTLVVWWPRRARRGDQAGPSGGWPVAAAWAVAAAGVVILAAAFVTWFPPADWSRIPILDDWPPRLQATREFLDGLRLGLASGWQWSFLGGYHTGSDVTQSLGLLAWAPMTLFGDLRGFHLLHALLFAAIPLLLWRDLTLDERAPGHRTVALTSVGIGSVLAASYSYMLIRSGDTNSLAGAVLVLSTLLGAHAARQGRWWGHAWLVVSLALTAWSHAGSYMYALVYLAGDALLARDWRSGRRAVVAAVAAQLAVLPMTWESWRYPHLFQFNNVLFTPPDSIDWAAVLRKVAYNVELLWLPGRWANDYGALALILLPVTVALAWADRSRARFYAVAALATVAMMRLNDPHFGYAFIRPIHMFPVLLGPVIAAALVRYGGGAMTAAGLLTTVVFLQLWWQPVPHIDSVRDVHPGLVERARAAEGALVLVENNPHRNTNAEPGGETAPSLTGNHYEALLAHETGRRLYAGYWDGWQWNPWRGQMLSGGTWQGRSLARVPPDAFIAELDRFGIVDLFVWAPVSREYFAADARYTLVWQEGPWTQFRRAGVDTREVVTTGGQADLQDRSLAGARVALRQVPAGSPVIVRTNYHPAFEARAGGRRLATRDVDGLLAFDAPCADACVVDLVYPRRAWLWLVALGGLIAGLIAARYDFGMVQK